MTTQDVALRDATKGAVAQFRDPDYLQAITDAAGDRVSPQQLVRAAATAVLKNPKLAAPNLRASLLQACLQAAMDGLLPDGREAAFVLFGQKVQYLSMIGGLRKIAAEHGIDLIARVVCENDEFNPEYDTRRANFKRTKLGLSRGDIIGAYAEAVHRDGRRWLEVMDVNEIERVRAVSRAKDADAWTNWWDRMAEKTVARKLFKQLPLDPKDRDRIERVLADDLTVNGDDAIAALYGRDEAAGEEGVAAPSPAAPTADNEPIPDEADLPESPPTVPTPPADGDITIDDGNVEDADWDDSGGANPPDDPPPFTGEEPPAAPPQLLGATFGSARYAGKTVQEVFEIGDVAYLRWALTHWQTGDIVKDLKAFAAQHPELTQN